jgi:hypothetical protein
MGQKRQRRRTDLAAAPCAISRSLISVKKILTRRRGIELNRRRGGILICVPADLLLVDSIEVIA